MIDRELLIAHLETAMQYHNTEHDFPWHTKKTTRFHYVSAKALSDAIRLLEEK